MEKKIPKVIMIASQEIIEEQSDGGKKGSFRNFELLKEVFGVSNVYICMFTDHTSKARSDSHIWRLKIRQNYCIRMINILQGRFFSNKKSEKKVIYFIIREKFDIVFIDRSLFGKLAYEIRKVSTCKIWVFTHNLEKNYFRNKLRKMPLLSSVICRKIEKSEGTAFHQADCIFALTKRDADLIDEIYGCKARYIIPSSFRDRYDVEKAESNMSEKLSLLFIGTMFGPNYNGIKWFVDNVMSKLGDVQLKIVGKNFEIKRSELESANVEVIGTVDDLESYYYSRAVMVMPVFYGDGQKIKTVEAMMYGKVILATNEALEGYDVDGTPGIFRCNTEEEFISVIHDLKHNGVPNEYSVSVRNLFLDKYSFQSIVNKYRKILIMEYEQV